MKKIFVLAPLAVLTIASCQKTEIAHIQDASQEVTINAFAKNMTKGYTGWTSGQTAFEEIADPDKTDGDKTDRKMILSAYNTTKGEDFFLDKTFAKKTDGVWAADPAIYYPLGGDSYSFLAYSVGTSNPAATWSGAKKVSLEVTPDSFQDDILFSTVSGASASTNAEKAIDMTFKHAQAWVNVNLCLAKGSGNVDFTVNSITWNNIYEQGILTLDADATPVASWNFFTQTTKNVAMDDTDIASGAKLAAATADKDGEKTSLNTLFPAQKHTGFVINYTIGSGDDAQTLEYEYEISEATWAMGTKYTYNIKINIVEVTVNPTVEIFVEEAPVEDTI